MTSKSESGHKDAPKGANLGQKNAQQEQKSDAELQHMGGKSERPAKDKQR
jgi:hypothetical protein